MTEMQKMVLPVKKMPDAGKMTLLRGRLDGEEMSTAFGWRVDGWRKEPCVQLLNTEVGRMRRHEKAALLEVDQLAREVG